LYLPKNIFTAGTYVLTGNLSCSSLPSAITINGDINGRVILDLGGFSVNGNYQNVGIKLLNNTTSATTSSVIIRNGYIQYFSTGIQAGDGNPGSLDNIQIQNITFRGSLSGDIGFNKVNNSIVSYCTFIGKTPGQSYPQYGVSDSGSSSGNRYVNLSFDGGQYTEFRVDAGDVTGTVVPMVLEHGDFLPATSN
jgi:hypothetical protein